MLDSEGLFNWSQALEDCSPEEHRQAIKYLCTWYTNIYGDGSLINTLQDATDYEEFALKKTLERKRYLEEKKNKLKQEKKND